jgi:hypothetical protein
MLLHQQWQPYTKRSRGRACSSTSQRGARAKARGGLLQRC